MHTIYDIETLALSVDRKLYQYSEVFWYVYCIGTQYSVGVFIQREENLSRNAIDVYFNDSRSTLSIFVTHACVGDVKYTWVTLTHVEVTNVGKVDLECIH